MKYQVNLADKDEQFQVEANQDLISAAKQQGVNMPHGCCNGECGGCVAKLVQGEASYQAGYQAKILSQQQREAGLLVCCMANAKSDLTLTAATQARNTPAPARLVMRLTDKTQLNSQVYQLTFTPENNRQLTFLPGQFVNIQLVNEQVRSYSIANAQNCDNSIVLQIKTHPGGLFSDQVRTSLAKGDRLDIELPLGQFYWRKELKSPIIMGATGTGLAPMLGMLEEMFADGCRQNVWLYWGCSKAQDLYWHRQLEAWQQKYANFHYTPVLSQPDDNWTGAQGHIHQAMVKEHPTLNDFQVYLAGSPAMIKKTQQLLTAFGLNQEQLFFDNFHPAQSKTQKTGFIAKLLGRFNKKKQPVEQL